MKKIKEIFNKFINTKHSPYLYGKVFLLTCVLFGALDSIFSLDNLFLYSFQKYPKGSFFFYKVAPVFWLIINQIFSLSLFFIPSVVLYKYLNQKTLPFYKLLNLNIVFMGFCYIINMVLHYIQISREKDLELYFFNFFRGIYVDWGILFILFVSIIFVPFLLKKLFKEESFIKLFRLVFLMCLGYAIYYMWFTFFIYSFIENSLLFIFSSLAIEVLIFSMPILYYLPKLKKQFSENFEDHFKWDVIIYSIRCVNIIAGLYLLRALAYNIL